jgi:hypothetical protein
MDRERRRGSYTSTGTQERQPGLCAHFTLVHCGRKGTGGEYGYGGPERTHRHKRLNQSHDHQNAG